MDLETQPDVRLAQCIPVIGIVGAIGAGKTTVACMLEARMSARRMSMAAPLKAMLLALGLHELDVNGPQAYRAQPNQFLGGKSPRYALQTLGTNWGRQTISRDIWVNAMSRRIHDIQHMQRTPSGRDMQCIVIDDIRFPNEFEMVHRLGGQIWMIRRASAEPKMDILSRFKRLIRLSPRIHESERYWLSAPADKVFHNEGDETDLRMAIMKYLSDQGVTYTDRY